MRLPRLRSLYTATSLCLLALSTTPRIEPDRSSLSDLSPGQAYSPYADRGFPGRPLWGDTHLHTALSVAAGLFGNRLDLEPAYKLARGEQVISSTGQPVELGTPLDWLVIAHNGNLSNGLMFPTDAQGQTHQRVSDGRPIGPDGRCRTPVGNTVDLPAAHWTMERVVGFWA